MSKNNQKCFIMRIAALIIGVLLVSWGIFYLVNRDYIEPTEVGVWMTNGGYDGSKDYEIRTGYFPVDVNRMTRGFTITKDPGYAKDVRMSFVSNSNSKWNIEVDYTFALDPSKAIYVVHNFKPALNADTIHNYIKDLVLSPVLVNLLRSQIQTKNDSSLMDRGKFMGEIEKSFVKEAANLGWTVTNFSADLTPPKAILDLSAARNQAEAAALNAKASTAKVNADLETSLAQARADAEVRLIQARSQAEANRLISSSLTPLLLQKMAIEKWNGENVGQMNLNWLKPN